jgi:hypothetical protein
MINGKQEKCSMQNKLYFPIGMGDTHLIWKKHKGKGKTIGPGGVTI